MSQKITVYTPIAGNYENLNLIYNSLKSQTSSLFSWYILNYGKEDINDFIKKIRTEGILDFFYQHKFFKGRYLATSFAFENIKTKYIIGLDGNYILMPNAIDEISKCWLSIENAHIEDVAEIRAFAQIGEDNSNRKLKQFIDKEFVNSTWHEMVLKKRNYYEMLASWDREKFLKAVNISNYSLFENEIDEVDTTLFWSSIGRKYKTRYLAQFLKKKSSIQDVEKKGIPKIVNHYNGFIYYHYYIKENFQYFFYNPIFHLKAVYHFIKSAKNLNLKFSEFVRLIPNWPLKIIVPIIYPLFFIFHEKNN
jgi:hypothetical protein